MLASLLLAGVIAAQAVGVGSGGTGQTTTVPPPTVLRTTTTPPPTTPPPTDPPPTNPPPTTPPPTSPPPTSPPPTSPPTAAPGPTPTRPPATGPGATTPASPMSTLPFTPSLEEPTPDEALSPADARDEAQPVGADEPSAPQGPSGPAMMRMDKPSTEPGGVVVLTGQGCVPSVPVSVGVADVAVGSIPGREDGVFVAILTLPDFGPGRYDINVDCGTTFTVPVDVVVATAVDAPNSVLALFIFFVLLVLVLFRRRRLHSSGVTNRSFGPELNVESPEP